jgi:hypothetical protein
MSWLLNHCRSSVMISVRPSLVFAALLASVLVLLSPGAWAAEPVIGIFGDVHGDAEIANEVLSTFKDVGVTHIIGMGDFIERGGPPSLDGILSMITPITGVPRDRIYLMPGNWEHETGFAPLPSI